MSDKEELETKEIKKVIKETLKKVGMKINLLGFKYWALALLLVAETKEIKSMTELYTYIANKYRTKPARVERTMRYAYKDLDLNKYFKVNYTISNSALFLLLIEETYKKDLILEN